MSRGVLVALALLLAAGCGPVARPHSGYSVTALEKADVIPGQVDARYFSREISDKRGLAAIELVYCPLVPGQPTVCRTAIVWMRDSNALIESPRGETM